MLLLVLSVMSSLQVMADAAHDCVKAIVTNADLWRIVQLISSATCRDRSTKLRLCCVKYLAQVTFHMS